VYASSTEKGGAAVPHPDDTEPPGFRELCAKLQTEKDPAKFEAVVEEIRRLLTAYEKTKKQD
jgi:hypothetical protein